MCGRVDLTELVLHVHDEARRSQQHMTVLIAAKIELERLATGETAVCEARHRVDDVGAGTGSVACAARQSSRGSDGGCIEYVHCVGVLVYY